MTKKLMGTIFGALLLAAPALAQEAQVAAEAQPNGDVAAMTAEKPAMPEPLNVMRDYRGVRPDMPLTEVRAVMGAPARSDDTWDEFKLDKNDLMTVHYNDGVVKAVQLYFTDADRAPEFVEVVGEIEPTLRDNGAKFARRVIDDGKYWVSMYQSADKKVTTVSIGRMQ